MTQAVEHALIRHQEIGTTFEGVYYVESAFVKQTVKKKDFTDLMLRDRSGARNVKYWGRVDGVSKGDYVFIAANVEEYLNNPSIIAKNIEKVDVPEDLSPFIPVYDEAGSNDNASRFDSIRAELAAIENVTGNQTAGLLVDEVYKNSAFFSRFIVSPGSGRSHYGRQGGLLANTVRVAAASLTGAESYGLNEQEKAVLLASALLARIGAIEAFEFQDCMPVVTKKGMLLGINNLTMSRISSALKRVVTVMNKEGKSVDNETVIRILHAVTSHDGVCVKPMTKEAMVLNAAFKTDAEIVDAMDFITADLNKAEEFTAWDPSTGRKYYTGGIVMAE
jgi:23S rRNA maturation-related 3'-5' exoribonuclease YhaM